jgi:hypothetical protein
LEFTVILERLEPASVSCTFAQLRKSATIADQEIS